VTRLDLDRLGAHSRCHEAPLEQEGEVVKARRRVRVFGADQLFDYRQPTLVGRAPA
jgi:hypothetical protein